MIQKELVLAATILNIARSQLGFAEIPKGSNWGPHVQRYLACVNIHFASPWCMAFVYWCVNEACKEFSVKNPIVRTGGVLKQWNECPRSFRAAEPKPGDIFIMDYGKGMGHTGIVEKADKTNIYTIEGNTNDEGSREGYEVCRRTRKRAAVKGYLRLA